MLTLPSKLLVPFERVSVPGPLLSPDPPVICPVTVRFVLASVTSRVPSVPSPNVIPRFVIAVGPVYWSRPGLALLPRTRFAGPLSETPSGPKMPPS